MTQINLVKNAWYHWTDPDDGICSKAVRYIDVGNEPGAVVVEDGMGVEFYVFAKELSELAVEKSEVKTEFDDLIFAPFMQFKSICNLRISKTGRVLALVNMPHYYHYSVSVPTEVGFDLANAYSVTLIEPTRVGDEEPRPATTTIVVSFAGGSLTFSAQTPEKTRVLYGILYKLRLYFMGFLEMPIEDESAFNLMQDNTEEKPQPWVVPSEVMPLLVNWACEGVPVDLRSISHEAVSNFAEELRQASIGCAHQVEVKHNETDGYYYIRIVINMYPVIAQTNQRVVDFSVDETYNHAMSRLSKLAPRN